MPALFWWEPAATTTSKPPALSDVELAACLGVSTVSFLGSGAFGETWKADLSDGPAAIKVVLDPHYPQEYLDREVAGLQRVVHPGVVRLREVRTLPLSGGARLALVFDFIQGGDVANRLSQGGWPTISEAEAFVVRLLQSVGAMHAANTVHRDIKPENVALRGGAWGEPVLLDLGLAKLLGVETLTAYPALMGTLPYMAPEQVREEPARKAADVWAVGIVAFILLARAHPFYDDAAGAILRNEAMRRLESGPRALPATVSEPMSTVVKRMLSFQPHLRGSVDRALGDLRTP